MANMTKPPKTCILLTITSLREDALDRLTAIHRIPLIGTSGKYGVAQTYRCTNQGYALLPSIYL